MIEVIYALWRRDMVKFLRDRRSLVTSLTRPFLWLLAFGFGLRGSVRLPGSGGRRLHLVPGAGAGGHDRPVREHVRRHLHRLGAGVRVPQGVAGRAGPARRHRGREAAGRSATALIEAMLMLALSPLIGARFSPLGALASLPLLALFGMAVNAPRDHRGRPHEVVRGVRQRRELRHPADLLSVGRALPDRRAAARRCARWCSSTRCPTRSTPCAGSASDITGFRSPSMSAVIVLSAVIVRGAGDPARSAMEVWTPARAGRVASVACYAEVHVRRPTRRSRRRRCARGRATGRADRRADRLRRGVCAPRRRGRHRRRAGRRQPRHGRAGRSLDAGRHRSTRSSITRRIVSRGVRRAHLVADMPFMSYQASVEDGMRAAGRLMKEGRAEAVKLEGGVEVAELVRRLVRAGIPVMGHVGLTPQSVHQLGGFKVQGRTDDAARADPRRRARGRRGGRLRHRDRGGAADAGRARSRARSRRSPSASAPAPTATAK